MVLLSFCGKNNFYYHSTRILPLLHTHYIHIITSGGGKFACGPLTGSLDHCSSGGFSAQPQLSGFGGVLMINNVLYYTINRLMGNFMHFDFVRSDHMYDSL